MAFLETVQLGIRYDNAFLVFSRFNRYIYAQIRQNIFFIGFLLKKKWFYLIYAPHLKTS